MDVLHHNGECCVNHRDVEPLIGNHLTGGCIEELDTIRWGITCSGEGGGEGEGEGGGEEGGGGGREEGGDERLGEEGGGEEGGEEMGGEE